MSEPSRLYRRFFSGHFFGMNPDPMTAGTSLNTVQTADDGRELTRRVPRQPRQLLVCSHAAKGRSSRLSGADACFELSFRDSMHVKLQAAPPFDWGTSYGSGCVFLQNLDHPELIITWGSGFPDKLKIRKEIPLWPFRFKLRADYSRALRAFEYGCSCKVSCYGT